MNALPDPQGTCPIGNFKASCQSFRLIKPLITYNKQKLIFDKILNSLLHR
jgi:hypothetical protein